MPAFEILLCILATLGLAVSFVLLLKALPPLRATTLIAAWRWGLGGSSLWTAAWAATLIGGLPPGVLDQLWYAVAVAMLCPLIAVLGARRPGVRVWTWFVLVPLLLVFSWPVLTVWMRGVHVGRLEIEEPLLLGYGLVLLMGFGNYFGTRYTLSALLLAAALALLAVPFSPTLPFPFPNAPRGRVWATLCLSAATAAAALAAHTRTAAPSPLERVWTDFRDLFGIVWARRFMDRINDTAEKERWVARLELHGLTWRPDAEEAARAETQARAEHAFHWLLRRFVDPEWIETRMGRNEGGRKRDEG